MGAYNSTKYAVESLSDALRRELAPFAIDVSIVEPGPIKSEFNEAAMATIDEERLRDSVYAPVIAQAARFRERFERRQAGPEVTTRAIAHAATARRPRIRYVVPVSSAVADVILGLLPTRLVDVVMRSISGLTRRSLLASPPGAA